MDGEMHYENVVLFGFSLNRLDLSANCEGTEIFNKTLCSRDTYLNTSLMAMQDSDRIRGILSRTSRK